MTMIKTTQTQTAAILTAEHLDKQYKVGNTLVQALRDVSISISKGEFVVLTGPSGSGKSTLLQLLGGLDRPHSGVITVAGQELSSLHDRALSAFRNRTIGFVFQFFYLQPFLDVKTNVEVPAIFTRTRRTERRERAQELLQSVGLAERWSHLPRELSGGQLQRAAIARALENNPPILLADEPTGNLDRNNAHAIFDLFRELCVKRGTTVVVVTHDLELAEHADRIIRLEDGAIV